MTKLLTKNRIKSFEQEQTQFGTKTALFNLYALFAMNVLKSIGVGKVNLKKVK